MTACDFGPAEVVEHGVSGWVVPPEDEASLPVRAWTGLLGDPDARRGRLAAAAGPARAAQFDIAKMIDAYTALFLEQAAASCADQAVRRSACSHAAASSTSSQKLFADVEGTGQPHGCQSRHAAGDRSLTAVGDVGADGLDEALGGQEHAGVEGIVKGEALSDLQDRARRRRCAHAGHVLQGRPKGYPVDGRRRGSRPRERVRQRADRVNQEAGLEQVVGHQQHERFVAQAERRRRRPTGRWVRVHSGLWTVSMTEDRSTSSQTIEEVLERRPL